jgi:hypothetical protein
VAPLERRDRIAAPRQRHRGPDRAGGRPAFGLSVHLLGATFDVSRNS